MRRKRRREDRRVKKGESKEREATYAASGFGRDRVRESNGSYRKGDNGPRSHLQ